MGMDAVLQLDGCYYLLPYTRRACVSSIVQNDSSTIVPKMSPDYKIPDQKVASFPFNKTLENIIHLYVILLTLICTMHISFFCYTNNYKLSGYRQHLPNEVILLICSKISCLRRLRGCVIHTR